MKRKTKELNPTIPAIIIWLVFMYVVGSVATTPIKRTETAITEAKGGKMVAQVENTFPDAVEPVILYRSNSKEELIKFVMNDIEGGDKYVKDGSGYAKYGINSKYNPDINVKTLTEKKAVEVYKARYWHKKLDTFKPAFQAVAFDALVNHGNSKDTWQMIDASNQNPAKLIKLRQAYYSKLPTYSQHKAGWMNRLTTLKQYAGK